MSSQDDYLSGQTFTLPVIWTKYFNKQPGKEEHFHWHPITFQGDNLLFLDYFLACYSSTFKLLNCVITGIYILTGQQRDMTELKFLLQVNMTGNNPKFILSLFMTNKLFTMISFCQCLQHTTCSPLRSCKILSFSNSAGPFPWPDLICNQYVKKMIFLHSGRIISVRNTVQNYGNLDKRGRRVLRCLLITWRTIIFTHWKNKTRRLDYMVL